MSLFTQNRWFRRLGFGAIAVIGIAAATLPAGSAQARGIVGFGAPIAALHHASYAPRIVFGFGGGHHHQDSHWRHWRR